MSAKTDYTALDAVILACLADGPRPFMILAEKVRPESEAAATPDCSGRVHGWRVVDRRLQALRKAGKIVPHRTQGWRLAAQALDGKAMP